MNSFIRLVASLTPFVLLSGALFGWLDNREIDLYDIIFSVSLLLSYINLQRIILEESTKKVSERRGC